MSEQEKCHAIWKIQAGSHPWSMSDTNDLIEIYKILYDNDNDKRCDADLEVGALVLLIRTNIANTGCSWQGTLSLFCRLSSPMHEGYGPGGRCPRGC